MPECTHCQRDLSNCQPVYLQQDAHVDRFQVGQFCTYACLTAYINTHDLTEGDESVPAEPGTAGRSTEE